MNREDNLCWFHGKVSRERAEQILKQEGPGDGVFLVRESNTAHGDYVLSVLHDGEVVHYQIRRHGEDAFFSIDDQTKIHGLDSLIEYYQKASHGLVTRLSAIVKQNPPPNDSRSHGRTNLLHRATKEGNPLVVSELLKCGYRNIDAKNQDGQTAIHLACRFGHEPILKKLIETQANVNSRDTDGNTALHYACRNSNVNIIKLLINAKANIQARNIETGCVPLHDAAKEGRLEVIKELLANGAPHMPRSSSGELPQDFAKENGHTEVVEFLENYTPSPSITFKNHWYHGTLDRHEAVSILQEYAKSLMAKYNELDIDPELSQYSSGIYLVRYSDRNGGSYVLTLLYENQPKNFIIKKTMNYLYIDEGPYMISLEHLIQHYTKFSDGLPTNLKYAVLPKPKPPIPFVSTIPKTKRLNKSASVPPPEQNDPSSLQMNQENRQHFSLSNTNMINQQGVWDKSPPPKESKSKSDILNFRSLKKPKRNMMWMKNFKKNDSKTVKEVINNRNSVESLEVAQKLMGSISFSTEFLNQPVDSKELYNTPKNNGIIVDEVQSSSFDNNDNEDQSTSQSYYIESDSKIRPPEISPQEEKLYFIDAPPETVNLSSTTNITNSANTTNNNMTFTPAGYIVSRNIPMFFDNPSSNTINNNHIPDRVNLERTTSNVSTLSERSESEFNPLINQQTKIVYGTTPNYFIPKENLLLETELGEGEFGSVYKGFLINSLNPVENILDCLKIPVAIKTLHDEHCKENRVDFLREASVMLQLRHHCIVRMIGISKGPPLRMVQELLPLGSMLEYLQNNANQLNPNFELKLWASQIACGMNYLESQHFVHRDLAARNILLASVHQVKISDFGLSRALGAGNDYYQASQGGKWPIKWYAPESFNFGTFSHASDVWSFGVTLWEMFSLGLPPYGEMKGIDVIKIIEGGSRLSKPVTCPDSVFNIMDSCWNYNPKLRPTFAKLTDLFTNDPEYQNITELVQTETIC